MLLTPENFNKGFLVDDEVIAGVTDMADGLYAAYMSHYLTGETLEYKEYSTLNEALNFLANIKRNWVYEGVGCSSKSSKSHGGCGSGNCGSSGCGPTSK